MSRPKTNSKSPKNEPLSKYLHPFYAFMFLADEAKEGVKRIRRVEKFYRTMLDQMCMDLPECEHLRAHYHTHGKEFVRRTLLAFRTYNPHLAHYMATLEHASVKDLMRELKAFHLKRTHFEKLENPKIKLAEIESIAKKLWKSGSQAVDQHHRRQQRRQKHADPYRWGRREPRKPTWRDKASAAAAPVAHAVAPVAKGWSILDKVIVGALGLSAAGLALTLLPVGPAVSSTAAALGYVGPAVGFGPSSVAAASSSTASFAGLSSMNAGLAVHGFTALKTAPLLSSTTFQGIHTYMLGNSLALGGLFAHWKQSK